MFCTVLHCTALQCEELCKLPYCPTTITSCPAVYTVHGKVMYTTLPSCRIVYTVHCTLHCTLHCMMHWMMHCTMHWTMHCTMHCTLHCTMHCTLHYPVHCTVHYTTLLSHRASFDPGTSSDTSGQTMPGVRSEEQNVSEVFGGSVLVPCTFSNILQAKKEVFLSSSFIHLYPIQMCSF